MLILLYFIIFSGYETDSVFEFIPCQKKIKPWGSAMYFYCIIYLVASTFYIYWKYFINYTYEKN